MQHEEKKEEKKENKVAQNSMLGEFYEKTDPKLREELSKTQFFFWRIYFPIRPKHFKRDLVAAAKGCNLQPRAQKIFFEGNIQTLLECFGLQENIKKLKNVLSQEDPNIIKIGVNNFTQSEQKCYLSQEDIETKANLKNFLYSKHEIEPTPSYMKRMKCSSDDGSKIFVAADLMQKKNDEAPLISRIVQNVSLVFKSMATITFNEKFRISETADVTLKINPLNALDLAIAGKDTSVSSLTVRDSEEEEVEIIFWKIGTNQNSYARIYPSEPVTTAKAYILSEKKNKNLEDKDIVLFNEHGKVVTEEVEMGKKRHNELFYGIAGELDLFLEKNPKYLDFFSKENDSYALFYLCANRWKDEIFFKSFAKYSEERMKLMAEEFKMLYGEFVKVQDSVRIWLGEK